MSMKTMKAKPQLEHKKIRPAALSSKGSHKLKASARQKRHKRRLDSMGSIESQDGEFDDKQAIRPTRRGSVLSRTNKWNRHYLNPRYNEENSVHVKTTNMGIPMIREGRVVHVENGVPPLPKLTPERLLKMSGRDVRAWRSEYEAQKRRTPQSIYREQVHREIKKYTKKIRTRGKARTEAKQLEHKKFDHMYKDEHERRTEAYQKYVDHLPENIFGTSNENSKALRHEMWTNARAAIATENIFRRMKKDHDDRQNGVIKNPAMKRHVKEQKAKQQLEFMVKTLEKSTEKLRMDAERQRLSRIPRANSFKQRVSMIHNHRIPKIHKSFIKHEDQLSKQSWNNHPLVFHSIVNSVISLSTTLPNYAYSEVWKVASDHSHFTRLHRHAPPQTIAMYPSLNMSSNTNNAKRIPHTAIYTDDYQTQQRFQADSPRQAERLSDPQSMRGLDGGDHGDSDESLRLAQLDPAARHILLSSQKDTLNTMKLESNRRHNREQEQYLSPQTSDLSRALITGTPFVINDLPERMVPKQFQLRYYQDYKNNEINPELLQQNTSHLVTHAQNDRRYGHKSSLLRSCLVLPIKTPRGVNSIIRLYSTLPFTPDQLTLFGSNIHHLSNTIHDMLKNNLFALSNSSAVRASIRYPSFHSIRHRYPSSSHLESPQQQQAYKPYNHPIDLQTSDIPKINNLFKQVYARLLMMPLYTSTAQSYFQFDTYLRQGFFSHHTMGYFHHFTPEQIAGHVSSLFITQRQQNRSISSFNQQIVYLDTLLARKSDLLEFLRQSNGQPENIAEAIQKRFTTFFDADDDNLSQSTIYGNKRIAPRYLPPVELLARAEEWDNDILREQENMTSSQQQIKDLHFTVQRQQQLQQQEQQMRLKQQQQQQQQQQDRSSAYDIPTTLDDVNHAIARVEENIMKQFQQLKYSVWITSRNEINSSEFAQLQIPSLHDDDRARIHSMNQANEQSQFLVRDGTQLDSHRKSSRRQGEENEAVVDDNTQHREPVHEIVEHSAALSHQFHRIFNQNDHRYFYLVNRDTQQQLQVENNILRSFQKAGQQMKMKSLSIRLAVSDAGILFSSPLHIESFSNESASFLRRTLGKALGKMSSLRSGLRAPLQQLAMYVYNTDSFKVPSSLSVDIDPKKYTWDEIEQQLHQRQHRFYHGLTPYMSRLEDIATPLFLKDLTPSEHHQYQFMQDQLYSHRGTGQAQRRSLQAKTKLSQLPPPMKFFSHLFPFDSRSNSFSLLFATRFTDLGQKEGQIIFSLRQLMEKFNVPYSNIFIDTFANKSLIYRAIIPLESPSPYFSQLQQQLSQMTSKISQCVESFHAINSLPISPRLFPRFISNNLSLHDYCYLTLASFVIPSLPGVDLNTSSHRGKHRPLSSSSSLTPEIAEHLLSQTPALAHELSRHFLHQHSNPRFFSLDLSLQHRYNGYQDYIRHDQEYLTTKQQIESNIQQLVDTLPRRLSNTVREQIQSISITLQQFNNMTMASNFHLRSQTNGKIFHQSRYNNDIDQALGKYHEHYTALEDGYFMQLNSHIFPFMKAMTSTQIPLIFAINNQSAGLYIDFQHISSPLRQLIRALDHPRDLHYENDISARTESPTGLVSRDNSLNPSTRVHSKRAWLKSLFVTSSADQQSWVNPVNITQYTDDYLRHTEHGQQLLREHMKAEQAHQAENRSQARLMTRLSSMFLQSPSLSLSSPFRSYEQSDLPSDKLRDLSKAQIDKIFGHAHNLYTALQSNQQLYQRLLDQDFLHVGGAFVRNINQAVESSSRQQLPVREGYNDHIDTPHVDAQYSHLLERALDRIQKRDSQHPNRLSNVINTIQSRQHTATNLQKWSLEYLKTSSLFNGSTFRSVARIASAQWSHQQSASAQKAQQQGTPDGRRGIIHTDRFSLRSTKQGIAEENLQSVRGVRQGWRSAASLAPPPYIASFIYPLCLAVGHLSTALNHHQQRDAGVDDTRDPSRLSSTRRNAGQPFSHYATTLKRRAREHVQSWSQMLESESNRTTMPLSQVNDKARHRVNEINIRLHQLGIFNNPILLTTVFESIYPRSLFRDLLRDQSFASVFAMNPRTGKSSTPRERLQSIKQAMMESIVKSTPLSLMKSICCAHLASEYVKSYGISPPRHAFYSFIYPFVETALRFQEFAYDFGFDSNAVSHDREDERRTLSSMRI